MEIPGGFTLLAESLRSFLDKSGKRKAHSKTYSPSSFLTYLGKIEATLLAG